MIVRAPSRRSGIAVVTIAVALVTLAACSSSKAPSANGAGTSPTSQSPAPQTSVTSSTPSGSGGGSCGGGLTAGQGGIIRIFCDGTATAKVTIGSATKTLTGGDCEQSGSTFAINFGAVAGPDFPASSPKPDYVGALIDSGGTASAFTAFIDGKGGLIIKATNSLSADKKTATLSGPLLTGGDAVTVDVTC